MYFAVMTNNEDTTISIEAGATPGEYVIYRNSVEIFNGAPNEVLLFTDGGTRTMSFTTEIDGNEQVHHLFIPQRTLEGSDTFMREPVFDKKTFELVEWASGNAHWRKDN